MKNDPIEVRWFQDQVARVSVRLDARVVHDRGALARRKEILDAALSDDLVAYREYVQVLDTDAVRDRSRWTIGESCVFALPSDPRRHNTPYTRKWK